MSDGKAKSNINSKSALKMGQAITAPIYGIDQAEYRQRVTDHLRLVFSNERHAAKRVAEIAGATVHAARNWLDSRCAPGGFHLSRLRAAIPELDAELRRLEGMEADNDPMFARELADLMRRYNERQQG